MTAIAGLIAWDGRPAGPPVRKALAALRLHGRDGEGLWDGGEVALGWRQTILTAEDRGDSQPRRGGDGRFQLVFDGRLDNREELAQRLSLPVVRDWPDSRLVMAAFEQWGKGCVPQLLGDFAFAVWDSHERELFLARDHIGVRPLFFHSNARFCMFASAASGLFANPDVPRDIDDNLFALHLAAIPFLPGETFYAGISRVPLAHTVTISRAAVRTACHWDPDAIAELHYKHDDDYVEAFREILDAAVRCRLRTIHPIGSQLSSGLDSSTVAVTAARLLAEDSRTLTAFSAVPPAGWRPTLETDAIVDEGLPAARLAASCGFDHVRVEAKPELDFAAHDRHGDVFEAPRRTFANVGWIEKLNQTARARGVRVMLGGGFGNRTISHDGLVRLQQLARGREFATLARTWAGLHRHAGMDYRALARQSFGPLLPDWLWEAALFLTGRPPQTYMMRCGLHPDLFTAAQLKRLGRDRLANPTNSRRMDVAMMRAVCSRSPDIASIWGSSLAAFDVETRDPTADRRMIAFRVAVSERQFLDHGEPKWLLRRAMRGTLPDFILDQRHHAGRQAAEWFDSATRTLPGINEEIERLAANQRTAAIVDIAWLRKLVDNWPTDIGYSDARARPYRRFLIVILAGRFLRRFLEQERYSDRPERPACQVSL